jgi:uncharacterized membrane protein
MKSLTAFLKATIVGGALYLVPIVLILVVLGKVQAVTVKLVAPITAALELHDVGGIGLARLLGIALIILACFAAGLFARTPVAQQFVGWLERAILSNLPGYRMISTLGADAVGAGHSDVKVVLARIEDAWQLALLVERVDETHAAVFVPGAPDPKSGSVYLLTDDRLKVVDVPMHEAMKCIKGLGVGSKVLLAGRL